MAIRVSIFAAIVLFGAIPTISAFLDYFSSTLKTKPLVEHHNQLVNILRQYALALSETASILNRYLSESELEKISQNWPNEGDPLRTYVLIRRTTEDLEKIINAIRKHRSLDPLLEVDNLRQKNLLPSNEDFKGISSSVLRLQRIYQLQATDIVEGNISAGLSPSVKLTAKDCLHLGETVENLTSKQTIPVLAKSWYHAGLDILKNETERDPAVDFDIGGMLQTGLERVNNKSKKFIKFPLELQDVLNKDIMTQPMSPYVGWEHTRLIYRRLCRGEQLRAPSLEKDTVCYIRQGPHPYLKLRPLKLEVKSWDPYLVVLHDIIGETDINTFQREAYAKAYRSTHVAVEHDLEVSDLRVSATAWLSDHYAPNLAQRLGIFLGLKSNASLIDVEEFQVLNYGTGGHYDVHRDFFDDNKHDRFYDYSGERLATLMLYLSDVEKGGSTVFPFAGLALKPKKGSAAFWWNLRTDGTGDPRTAHGACPVIYGTKWVSNKWFRVRPQMFHVPCSLDRNDIVKKL